MLRQIGKIIVVFTFVKCVQRDDPKSVRVIDSSFFLLSRNAPNTPILILAQTITNNLTHRIRVCINKTDFFSNGDE